MSRAARKQLLLVACTIDRVNLLSKLGPRTRSHGFAQSMAAAPWVATALTVAMKLLPPQFRTATLLWRLFRRAQARTR